MIQHILQSVITHTLEGKTTVFLRIHVNI